jgi:hypothetical protein
MARLELDERESEALRQVLEEYVSDLRMEIAGTDSHGFREGLKEKEELLKRILGRIGSTTG